MQEMMNAVGDILREQRSRYHVTLGQLINLLEHAPGEATVVFSDNTCPGVLHSYRGYATDLAFEPRDDITEVDDLLDQCLRARGTKFPGWKGGEHVMDHYTPLWKAEPGRGGEAIIGAHYNGDLQAVILSTKQVGV